MNDWIQKCDLRAHFNFLPSMHSDKIMGSRQECLECSSLKHSVLAVAGWRSRGKRGSR